MSPFYKVESKEFAQSYKRIQFLLWNLKSFNVCCPFCVDSSTSVYEFISASNATRASHVSNGAGQTIFKVWNMSKCLIWPSGVFPLEPAGVKNHFCHVQPPFFNFVEINLGPAYNTPIAISRNREDNREENPSPSPKCRTIHQTGPLTVHTSQGHSLEMFLIICLLADVLQSFLGKSR